jgi:hypothetical protein
MDEAERIISRLNSIDPARPYFDPLAVEEAVRRHARLIGFRNVAFTWVMGPAHAGVKLAKIVWKSREARRWYLTARALQDQATSELQRDKAVWNAYRRTQREAKARVAETLHLEPFHLTAMACLDDYAAENAHNIASLVAAFLCDLIASAAVDNERLQDLNEVYLPFTDALLAGLGTLWVVDERFICLPLPRLSLKDGKLVRDGGLAVIWPNGEVYAMNEDSLIKVMQTVER